MRWFRKPDDRDFDLLVSSPKAGEEEGAWFVHDRPLPPYLAPEPGGNKRSPAPKQQRVLAPAPKQEQRTSAPAPNAEQRVSAPAPDEELRASPPAPDKELRASPLVPDKELRASPPVPDEDQQASAPASYEYQSAWAPSRYRDKPERASVRSWAMGSAAALGLGIVLLSSWTWWDSQSPTSERTPQIAADAQRARRAEQASAGNAAQPTVNGATVPDKQGGPTIAAATAPGRPFEDQRPSNRETAADQPAATDMQVTQSNPDVTPTVETPAAAAASSPPATASEDRALAAAPTPPAARAPAIATSRADTGRSAIYVRNPPQWLGGGPTDADNPQGRYQGRLTVQVRVAAGGRVTNCATVRGSGNSELDAMTCRLIRERAQFSPALDVQGRPVASQTYTTIIWGRKPRR
jgi:TonB family protein